VLSVILEAEGYQVYECEHGQQALNAARSIRPGVITLDLALPDLDGRQLLAAFRADHVVGDIPIVVVSAYADVLTPWERQLADDVVIKPFDLDDLLGRLRRLVPTESEVE